MHGIGGTPGQIFAVAAKVSLTAKFLAAVGPERERSK